MRTEKEKMLSGELYFAGNEELISLRRKALALCKRLDEISPYDEDKKSVRGGIVSALLGKCGQNVFLGEDFRCDYGKNIAVGDNFYANYSVHILDVCKVSIGDNCLIGPDTGIYTACHPVNPQERLKGLEYGKPVTIGDNCWIGGNVVINPGVTLGDNVVVGSGSVVTKSFPSNVVIAGNPAKVIKTI